MARDTSGTQTHKKPHGIRNEGSKSEWQRFEA